MKKLILSVLCAGILMGCAQKQSEPLSSATADATAVSLRTGTVICVGDSITYGAGVSETLDTETWPIQLQNLLGNEYNVINLGINGRTLLKEGDYPYTENQAYQTSLNSNADIVLIMLGTNDSKPQNWNAELYKTELIELIQTYQALDSHPDVYAMTCPDVIIPEGQDSGSFGVDKSVVEEQLPSLIQEAADATGAGLIDIYSATYDRADCFSLERSLHLDVRLLTCYREQAKVSSVRTREYIHAGIFPYLKRISDRFISTYRYAFSVHQNISNVH